jgi:hypothetical protein
MAGTTVVGEQREGGDRMSSGVGGGGDGRSTSEPFPAGMGGAQVATAVGTEGARVRAGLRHHINFFS